MKTPYRTKTHVLWNTAPKPHFRINEIRLISQEELGDNPLPEDIASHFAYWRVVFDDDPAWKHTPGGDSYARKSIQQYGFEAWLLEIIMSYGGISRDALTGLYRDLARLKVNGYHNAPVIAATLGTAA